MPIKSPIFTHKRCGTGLTWIGRQIVPRTRARAAKGISEQGTSKTSKVNPCQPLDISRRMELNPPRPANNSPSKANDGRPARNQSGALKTFPSRLTNSVPVHPRRNPSLFSLMSHEPPSDAGETSCPDQSRSNANSIPKRYGLTRVLQAVSRLYLIAYPRPNRFLPPSNPAGHQHPVTFA